MSSLAIREGTQRAVERNAARWTESRTVHGKMSRPFALFNLPGNCQEGMPGSPLADGSGPQVAIGHFYPLIDPGTRAGLCSFRTYQNPREIAQRHSACVFQPLHELARVAVHCGA
jgi:hypothetical protein